MAGLPTLLLLSGADEYVPSGIDYRALGKRLQAAVGPSAQLAVIESGTHALSGSEEQAADEIVTFVKAL